jgi:hypothetical protein
MSAEVRTFACRSVSIAALVAALVNPSPASAQSSTFKLAWFNIQSGKGEPAMTGHPSTFSDVTNCTDTSQPMNAWGVGFLQQHLVKSVANDPKIVALGLAESWASVCGSPENVRKVLGWKSRTSERNGVAMVAKYGFAGPEEWVQLDTSLNSNPADTMWVLRIPVCLDSACSQNMNVFAAHWYSSGTNKLTSYDRQASQTADFLKRAGGTAPHVLIGDLNVWDGTTKVCGENPTNIGLQRLRDAGYIDAWPLLHGSAEGYTGMTNRAGCGDPIGYTWKRPDYTWSPSSYKPVSITRWGTVTPGDEAPSDHYGLITEFPFPGRVQKLDATAPVVSITSPFDGQSFTGGTLTISANATDDVGVMKVDLIEDGAVMKTLTAPPYQTTSNIASVDGTHTIAARAYDAAGNTGTASVTISVQTTAVVLSASDVVLYAKNASTVAGAWQRVADAQAAGGTRMYNPDAAAAKLTSPLASPANFFELTFNAEAGRGYRVWLRGKADNNYWGNDSVWLQFDRSVNVSGTPVFRIGTTDGTWAGIEDCSGCGLAGWGWQDNGYGTGVLGPLVYFATTGTQTIRVQQREDGISLDQIVLSADTYLTNAPGANKLDATILPLTTTVSTGSTSTTTVSTTEILIKPTTATQVAGTWQLMTDTTAANGAAMGNADAGAAKITTPLAAPANYVEFTFQADAGKDYRLWMRGRAQNDSWANDSVYVQFDGSVDATGAATSRIGTTSAYTVNLEDDANVGLAAWGWQDNGYGLNVLGPLVRFATSGTHTIRIQVREDGFRFDQIVLSSQKYLTTAPGALKNDTTILP